MEVQLEPSSLDTPGSVLSNITARFQYLLSLPLTSHAVTPVREKSLEMKELACRPYFLLTMLVNTVSETLSLDTEKGDIRWV